MKTELDLIREEMASEYKLTTIIDEEMRNALEDRAKQENRSMSNLVATILKNEIQKWLPEQETAAEKFLLQVTKEGKRPPHSELVKLAQELDIEEKKLVRICDRLFPKTRT